MAYTNTVILINLLNWKAYVYFSSLGVYMVAPIPWITNKVIDNISILLSPVGSEQSLPPASIFVPNFCSFLIIRQQIKRSICCFIPVISFKIGYVKHWLSQNFAQSISKMATEYTLENWGLKNLIDSRKSKFVNSMTDKKFADVKGTSC